MSCSCRDLEERLSPLLEGRLGGAEKAALAEHLLACASCRALRDEIKELLRDMKGLAELQDEPEGLADRILASVPAPGPSRSSWAPGRSRSSRSAGSLAWRRAAVWAFVFFGAWWQLVGTNLSELAAGEIAPAAASIVAEAREATLRRRAELLPAGDFELSEPIDMARDSLAAFSRNLHRALFVPESQREEPQGPPSPVPSDGVQKP